MLPPIDLHAFRSALAGIVLGIFSNLLTDFLKTSWRVRRTRRGVVVRSIAERRAAVLLRAERLFDGLRLLVPTRLCDEDLGDALELLRQLDSANAPPRSLYLKIASTVFWIMINVAREDAASLSDRANHA